MQRIPAEGDLLPWEATDANVVPDVGHTTFRSGIELWKGSSVVTQKPSECLFFRCKTLQGKTAVLGN